MKTTIKISLSLLLSLLLLATLIACDDTASSALWENATYQKDATVGEGATSVTLLIEAGEKSITLTLKTDKEKLGDAMFEVGLIEDASFFSILNGIEASWSADQAYWAFYQGETLMNHGVNDTTIESNAQYRFVYTK